MLSFTIIGDVMVLQGGYALKSNKTHLSPTCSGLEGVQKLTLS